MREASGGAAPIDGPLAIICGGGALPFAVADAARRQGRQIVLFALRGWADPRRIEAYPHYWMRLGEFGRFCRVARQEGCREVVFIGSLVRPARVHGRSGIAIQVTIEPDRVSTANCAVSFPTGPRRSV